MPESGPETNGVLVSACLLGRSCRYDGASKPSPAVQHFLRGTSISPVCPEELGGLGTPRPPAELYEGDGAAVLCGEARVLRAADRHDVTEQFVLGALRARQARPEAQLAVLKAGSPSCGAGFTSINGQRVPGDGVFAALLRAQGVSLLTEESLPIPPLDLTPLPC